MREQRAWFLGLCGVLFTGAAAAEPIPQPIIDIITEAANSGDDATLGTTVDLAKRTNPNSIDEIDALVADLHAQAEAARIEEAKSQGYFEGWSGEGEVGVTITTGAAKNTTLALGIRINKEGVRWRHKIVGLANYESSNNVITDEDYLASYEADFKFTPRFFAYGFGQWEQDPFSGIDVRYTASVGLGYLIIDNPEIDWQVMAGPAYRHTEFVSGFSEDEAVARVSTEFIWNVASTTVFREFAGLYIGTGNNDSYFSYSSVTTKLFGSLAARASFDITVETNPPPGIASTRTNTRFTLVYAF